MIDFLKRLEENSQTQPDTALFSEADGRIVTYGEFYELTGRTYAYLKQRGIGNEDFVLACLPRGCMPIAASLGILRAGAAFVIVEDSLPAERIEYIRHDCGCKLFIDEACWREILATEPLAGYEQRDAHSAAFAVYTSGTTGAPKGVVHEYGNVERMILSSPLPKGPAVSRFALCSPLNFILSALAFLVLVYEGTTLIYVVPFATVKDPRQFGAFLAMNQITFSFLSPLFVRKLAPILKSLAFCVVGGEPANDLYSNELPILNGYTMSECGFVIGAFIIDKPYANTPAGKPSFECPTRLLGEDGQEVPAGEKGEIVTWNPYVRGYLNLPEKTAAVFKDGWYHTGDLGCYDEQGNLVICGRIDDMAKINGNRVEPGEVEIAARQELGLQWAAAKVLTKKGKSSVCLYYLDPEDLDADAAREKLAKRLPHYMLPTFFIHVDEVPLTAAGKFNRRGLPDPHLDDDQAEYRAPENDAQRALCDAFAKVLGVARAGIDDDFFRLGGDSMAAMEIVISSGLDGLSAADVFKGRTPEGIAALYAQRGLGEDPDEINDRARGRDYPLTPNQAYTVEWQLREPESTMRSVASLLRLDKDVIDMERMARAITTAAANHPALMTEIYRDEQGELRQRFSADMACSVELERLSEDEFARVRETLVRPFAIIGEPLFRARAFQTEAAGYVFVDVHHAVFDGASNGVLLSDVMTAYSGGELPKDYYPFILETQGCLPGTDSFEENRAYFEDRYGDTDWCTHLALSGKADNSAIGVRNCVLPVSASQLDQAEKASGVSANGFLAIAGSIATALCTGKRDVMLFWTFNGRTDTREMHSVGTLRCGLPLAFSLTDSMTLAELFSSVNDQISGGISHCRYPYLEQNQAILDEGVIRVIYQGSMKSTPRMPGFLGTMNPRQGNLVSRAFVNLEIMDRDGGYAMMARYTQDCFRDEDVEGFVGLFNKALAVLVAHAEDGGVTLGALSQEIAGMA